MQINKSAYTSKGERRERADCRVVQKMQIEELLQHPGGKREHFCNLRFRLS